MRPAVAREQQNWRPQKEGKKKPTTSQRKSRLNTSNMEYKLDQIVNKAAFKSNKDEHESLAVHRRCKEEEGGGGLGGRWEWRDTRTEAATKRLVFLAFFFLFVILSLLFETGDACARFFTCTNRSGMSTLGWTKIASGSTPADMSRAAFGIMGIFSLYTFYIAFYRDPHVLSRRVTSRDRLTSERSDTDKDRLSTCLFTDPLPYPIYFLSFFFSLTVVQRKITQQSTMSSSVDWFC